MQQPEIKENYYGNCWFEYFEIIPDYYVLRCKTCKSATITDDAVETSMSNHSATYCFSWGNSWDFKDRLKYTKEWLNLEIPNGQIDDLKNDLKLANERIEVLNTLVTKLLRKVVPV